MGITERLLMIHENVDEVHEAGYNKGYKVGRKHGEDAGGYTEGYEDGKQAEYDAFWDVYQTEGDRRDYQYGAFSGRGWTNQTFKPKYPIIARNVYGMFQGTFIEEIRDIDFSAATSFNNVFAYSSRLLKIGKINVPKASRMDSTFSSCTELHTIEKITVSESCTFTSTFSNCPELKNITYDGVIGNSINFSTCTKLTKDSITSIINHLSDTATGKTLTLSATAVATAFEVYPADYDGDGKTDAWIGNGEEEWYELITPKSNWTIVVV